MMHGLISSCTSPGLQTYPKIAQGTNFFILSLYGNKLRQVEGGLPFPQTGGITLLNNIRRVLMCDK